MRIRPEHLPKELKQGLLPVYLITGDETLLVQEAMDSIRRQCKDEGFSERKVLNVDRQFDWKVLEEEASALSLFSEKKLIELKLGTSKPGTPGAKALQAYLSNPPEDNVLLIEAARLDAATLKSKWASNIDKAGAIIQVWPVGLAEMPRWIQQRAGRLGLHLESDAISLLAERLEGNLLAASQELEKLKLNYPDTPINTDAVESSVEDSSRYDIFNLTDACLAGHSKQAIKILSHLKMEGQDATICLWALSKETRLLDALRGAAEQGQPPQQVFKKFRVIQKRQTPLLNASRRITARDVKLLLDLCKLSDEQIKGLHPGASAWETLIDIVMILCGTALPSIKEGLHA